MGAKKPKFERVVQFKASDGSLHPTYAAAEKYEKSQELTKWLEDWLDDNCEAYEGPSPQRLAEALKAEWNISRKRSKQ
jgi:hypothetical protein